LETIIQLPPFKTNISQLEFAKIWTNGKIFTINLHGAAAQSSLIVRDLVAE
jgi:hypothetical protein